MARPLRIIYEGAFYHVTARGNERKKIFLSRRDYEKFLSYLKDALDKYGVRLHGYALMGNHYHLILETPLANLSSFMHTVNSGYTTYFNIKRNRSGHLFQGRYKAILVEKESYLLELSRYVHLNPVRAKLTEKPEDYPWSSYRAYISPEETTIVSRDLILGMAPHYKEFVEFALGKDIAAPSVYGGMILGSKQFIKDSLARIKKEVLTSTETSHRKAIASHDLKDIIHTLAVRFKTTEEIIRTASPYRSYAIYLARKHTVLSNREIGAFFGGIGYTAVSKTGTRLKEKMGRDKGLGVMLGKVEALLYRVKG
jgi:putative transposase